MPHTLERGKPQVRIVVQDRENLAKPIQGILNGRGLAECCTTLQPADADLCLCQKPYTDILCQNCGHLMFGRVNRDRCPKHPMVTFLLDITHCSRCKCPAYMLSECDTMEKE